MKYVNVQNVNKKYSKISAKLAEEMPWNKICVYLIGPFKVRRKVIEPIILKAVTTIDTAIG